MLCALGKRLVTFTLLTTSGAVAAQAQVAADWKFDVVRLKNGREIRGLILSESPVGIEFQNVRRNPGRPTAVFTTTFSRNEIDSIERLSDRERELLRERVLELSLDPSERQRSERVELEKTPWFGQPDAGWTFRSDCFILSSNAPEPIVRRAAAQLEQIYAAYQQYLPPRVALSEPTKIELFQSQDEYAARLKAEGRRFINTAFFDPAANRILCTGDLARLSAELEKSRQQFKNHRLDLDQLQAKLERLYKPPDLNRHLDAIRAARGELNRLERLRESDFAKATQRLFAAIYHEAFHAYLAGFVYPKPIEMPRWLNEGLAQVFETALVEAGELRVGHADRERLGRAKDAIRKKSLIPLNRLLTADAPQFLAAHDSDRGAADLHYLTAWAVAHYLTFERRVLGSDALDIYLRALAGGNDPEVAFAKLVGQPVAEFERDFLAYLGRLQPDGSLAPAPDR
jgi:hypothetical protein